MKVRVMRNANIVLDIHHQRPKPVNGELESRVR